MMMGESAHHSNSGSERGLPPAGAGRECLSASDFIHYRPRDTSRGRLASRVGSAGTWSRSPLGGSRLPLIPVPAGAGPRSGGAVYSWRLHSAPLDSRKLSQVSDEPIRDRANGPDHIASFPFLSASHDTDHGEAAWKDRSTNTRMYAEQCPEKFGTLTTENFRGRA